MSLDVYLVGPETEEPCMCECGNQHTKKKRPYYFDANITHNLNKMAQEAGIYQALWRPEEIQVTTAGQLIPLLTEGLARLKANPVWFRSFNPSNNWGTYEGLVSSVEAYLRACEEHPEADIQVSR